MTDMPGQAVRSAAGTQQMDPGFGVYVHWPFCRSKCPYCDFNSHVRESVDVLRWQYALLAELDHYAGQTPVRTVTSGEEPLALALAFLQPEDVVVGISFRRTPRDRSKCGRPA